ncbi:MAG: rhamnogalacturonan endolyase [Micromonosporaceae bacterium]
MDPSNESRHVSRRSALGALGTAMAGVVLARRRAESTTGVPVQLIDNGDTVTLANAKVSVTVNKATAQIPNIQLIGSVQGNQDVNLVSGTNGQGYTTFDYYIGTTRFSKGLSGGSYRVVSRSDERVEIAISAADPAVLPFTVDVHLALERDTPGVHCYMVFGYPDGMPDALTIQQLRYAFAAGDPSFTYFVVDDRRGVQQRPSTADMARAVTLQDATYLLPDGRVYTKYQNISDLEGDSHAFMISNGRLGMAIVQASKEAFAGGPTKQELTCHDYYDGEILLWHPFTSHYGSPDLQPPRGWAKVYGPFYLHVNEAAGGAPAANVARMWADAKRAAARERRRWPYRWVSEPGYAAGTRSQVSGRLAIAGGRSPAGAWVVLSPPGPDRVYQGLPLDGDDWQYQNLDYVYSARADRSGRFTVDAVRPGTYTLSAFVDGVLGEYQRHGVTVGARARVDAGHLVWRPERHGTTLWQLGVADRSAGEFHIDGGPNGFRDTLTWLEYPYEFPDGADLRVGVDDPVQQWNYFQPCFRTPGTPLQLQLRGTTPDRTLTTWRIRFPSRGHRAGTATLDIALAGSVFGTLRIALNDTELASFDPLPGPAGDNSSYRLARRGMYRRLPPVTFAADLIRPGENVLSFSPVRPPKAPLTRGNTVDDWMEPMAGIMYDTIRLQVDGSRQIS